MEKHHFCYNLIKEDSQKGSPRFIQFDVEKLQNDQLGNTDFDVPMGYYDGTQVWDVVGIYNLNQINNVMDKKCLGLYRDDGLCIFSNLSAM